jgi:hypothetical protein
VKVKKEVQRMASVGEVDGLARAARHIGDYLNMQSYRVRNYIMSGG